jgi:hypothetical protein
MMLVERIDRLLAELGETDCEELADGLLAQPVNAISSLSYVVVGLTIAVLAVRSGRQLTNSLVYAGCLAAVGLGSVAFHGPQTSGSQVMHDLPILITALFILNHDLAVARGDRRRELWTFAAVSAVATMVSIVSPGLVPALTGLVVGGVLIVEYVIFRRRLRPIDPRRQRRIYVAIVIVAAVAGASWLLGRSNSPACDPGSVVQLHGLWHIVSSGIFGLWWWLALADDR